MSILQRKHSLSSKVIISIIALSVLIILLPAIIVVAEEASEVVEVEVVVAVAADVVVLETVVVAVVALVVVVEEVVEVLVSVVDVVVVVECLHSRERELHSKPCLSGTFLLTRGELWALLACGIWGLWLCELIHFYFST